MYELKEVIECGASHLKLTHTHHEHISSENFKNLIMLNNRISSEFQNEYKVTSSQRLTFILESKYQSLGTCETSHIHL